jgi:hypothetical protein
MLNPSRRHIFQDWTPQPFPVHEDVGLEVGKVIIRKMAKALGHPTPATPSARDSREMMMNRFWRTHGLDEVHKGKCGPQLKKCLRDVITELGDLNEVNMKEQITIRITKTMHPPLLHSSRLIRTAHNCRTPRFRQRAMTYVMNGVNKQTPT